MTERSSFWCMLQAGPPSLHYYFAVVLHSCIILPLVGHSSFHEYHYCQLTRQTSCFLNFYCTFKVFIWISLVICFGFWATKAKDIYSEYVTIIAFPLRQWLRERSTMSHLRIHSPPLTNPQPASAPTKLYRSLHVSQSWEDKISTCASRNTASSTKPLRFITVFTAPATGQCHDPHESSPNTNILFKF
jgi:hypothetical protein